MSLLLTSASTHLPPQWQQRLLACCNAKGWNTGQFGSQQLRLLTAWAQAEGGTAQWNPLNTTYALPWGSTNYNTSGVKNYAQPIQGVTATALTLLTSHNPDGTLTFGHIAGWLQAGTTTAEECVTANSDQFQTWGTNPALILQILGSV